MSSDQGKLAWTLRIIFVRLRFIALMVGAALAVAYWDTIAARIDRALRPAVAPDAVGDAAHEYYCPMHPAVVRAEPGNCPICGMPLAKRKKGERAALPEGTLARVELTPYRVRLAGVSTTAVARRPLIRTVEAVGAVQFDERRLARISARVRGRIERLHVDYTGAKVKKGDPLVTIYSQELFASARELGLAKAAGGGPSYEAARERLLLWGLTPEQVTRMAETGRPVPSVDVVAPIAGTVIERKVLAGDYVAEGQEMYTVADLSLVWAVARVFEDEVAFVHLGEPVAIRSVSYPGRLFEGRVSFIDPVLDAETRTVRVRADVPNADGLLKPGMYVTAELRVPIGADGRPPVLTGEVEWRCCTSCPEIVSDAPGMCPKCGMPLTPVEKGAPPPPATGIAREGMPPECTCVHAGAGTGAATSTSTSTKTVYWCPMHPEVTQDAPGECAKCGGMKLVAKEVRAAAGGGARDPLAVPASAVIDTGRRKVAWKEVGDGVFEAVEVTLGPRAGEWYPVVAGLAEGEKVVAQGAFLIDAEARLNPSGGTYFGASGGPQAGHEQHGGAR